MENEMLLRKIDILENEIARLEDRWFALKEEIEIEKKYYAKQNDGSVIAYLRMLELMENLENDDEEEVWH